MSKPYRAEEIITLISRATGIHSNDIRLDSRLLHDLGVSGDDAAELLETFSRHFSVDMSGFSFPVYFTGEVNWENVCRALGISRNGAIFEDKKPLTVSKLIEIAQIGRWVDER